MIRRLFNKAMDAVPEWVRQLGIPVAIFVTAEVIIAVAVVIAICLLIK